jgi:hypothetical protein
MDTLAAATEFFHACETAKGWAGCQQYVAEGATFTVQSEPIADIKTVEAYCDWMAGFVENIAPDATYEIHTSSYDPENRAAIFFATIHATHTLDGGPVPPTNKKTHAHYVYILTMDEDNKVERMVKVWNSGWTFEELGWNSGG